MKKLVPILALILCFKAGHSQSAGGAGSAAYSLQQAIEYAYKNSPSVMNAELDIQSSVYKKKELLGVGLPQINGSVDIKDYLNLPTSLLPAQFFGGAPGTFAPVKFGTKYNATAGF